MGGLTLLIEGATRPKGQPNEDAYFVDRAHRLFGVFDGVGATAQATWAARLAAVAVRAAYATHDPGPELDGERRYLSMALRGAGTMLARTLEDGLTTASVVRIVAEPDGGTRALIGNVGDSRVYRSAVSGELRQCTLDDSRFGDDWEMQRRLGEVVEPTDLLELVYLQYRHVLDRALGEGLDQPRMFETPVDAGDALVAVTDGVSDNLTFTELGALVHEHRREPDRLARSLVDAAFARSQEPGHPRAKTDDITAVAVVVGAA